MRCQQIFIILASRWIIGRLIKIGRLESNGSTCVCIDNESIIMKNLDLILTAVFCMGKRGFTGTGQAVNRSNIFAAVCQCVFFLSSL